MRVKEKHIYKAGETALVFNATEWRKVPNVGQDPFFEKAEILKVGHGYDCGRSYADVKFIESGLISNGHLQSCMKPIKP